MKTVNVSLALVVCALLLGVALASCGCSSSGRDVCGGGCSKSTVVRPAPFIPPPKPSVVVRKYVTVVEEQQPAPQGCYVPQPAPQPAPQPCYRPAPKPAPQPCYVPQPAPQPCYVPQPAPQQVYVPVQVQQAPVVRKLYRAAPQPTCSSCYRPASDCGCQ